MMPRSTIAVGILTLALAGCQRQLPADSPVQAGPPTAVNATMAQGATPLRIIIMDPLAAPLSCACVQAVGQRRYDRLSEYLQQALGRSIELTFDESLALGFSRVGRKVQFVVGPDSVVRADGLATKATLRPVARLTNSSGSLDVRGQFIVRADDSVRSLEDLRGRTVVLGPEDRAETNSAALAALNGLDIASYCKLETASSIEAAVLRVVDGEADAAVISDFLLPLLEGCGKIERGTLRAIGTTGPVPFVAVFATDWVTEEEVSVLRRALDGVSGQRDLLQVLESRGGFVSAGDPALEKSKETFSTGTYGQPQGWTDWRGPQRHGVSPDIPLTLAKEPRVPWTAKLTGPALAGVAATAEYVVVPDKDAQLTTDIFRCFEAAKGEEAWTLQYPAADEIDYTNAPRATPVIAEELVYLQGALGHLHCVELATGRVVWKKNIIVDFGAERLTWGCSVPPLVVGDKLIVAPGAMDASLVGLNRKTGDVIWKSPGHAGAYAAFIVETVGGVPEIIGYDVAGLGGWDPTTGRQLWRLTPPGQADFHVGTPLVIDGEIVVATENNATRKYRVAAGGRINPDPVARNEDFAPDTCTPVVWGRRLFGAAYGTLYCLDLSDGLKTLWSVENDMFYEHTNLIAGNDRVLLWTTSGDLLLLRADSDRYDVLTHLRPFGAAKIESMSHPAIVPGRLYLRSDKELRCLSLEAT